MMHWYWQGFVLWLQGAPSHLGALEALLVLLGVVGKGETTQVTNLPRSQPQKPCVSVACLLGQQCS